MRHVPTAMLFAALAAASGAAQAQNIGGAVRLSLDGNFVGYRTYQIKVPTLPVAGQTQPTTRKQTVTETSFGLLQPGYGVGVGYGVTDGLILGGRLLLATATTDAGAAGKLESSTVAVAPYVQYLFNPGSALRPFVGADVGFQTSLSKGATARQKSSGFFAGPAVGVHLFAAPGFSVSGGASVYYESRSVELGGANTRTSGVAAVGTISLSGWLGAPSKAPKAVNEATVAPPSTPAPAPSAAQAADWDVHSERGVLYLKAPITHAVELSIQGRPLSNPDRVTLAVLVSGSGHQLKDCREFGVVAGDDRWTAEAVKYRRAMAGSSLAEALEGQVPASSMTALGEATGEVAIEACGVSWPVPDYMQLRVASLATEFRKKAEGRSLGLPQRSDVEEERGVVSTTLPLSGAVTLTLKAKPANDGQHVEVGIDWQGHKPVVRDCRQVSLSADGKTFELEDTVYSYEPTETQWIETLAGRLDLRAVLALAESRQAPWVKVCGHGFTVSEAHRLRAFNFAELFVQRARAGGTWAP